MLNPTARLYTGMSTADNYNVVNEVIDEIANTKFFKVVKSKDVTVNVVNDLTEGPYIGEVTINHDLGYVPVVDCSLLARSGSLPLPGRTALPYTEYSFDNGYVAVAFANFIVTETSITLRVESLYISHCGEWKFKYYLFDASSK